MVLQKESLVLVSIIVKDNRYSLYYYTVISYDNLLVIIFPIPWKNTFINLCWIMRILHMCRNRMQWGIFFKKVQFYILQVNSSGSLKMIHA